MVFYGLMERIEAMEKKKWKDKAGETTGGVSELLSLSPEPGSKTKQCPRSKARLSLTVFQCEVQLPHQAPRSTSPGRQALSQDSMKT